MEWKPYYDAELRQPGTREVIADWVRAAGNDDPLSAIIENRAVLSFPHTAVEYSGPIQARVVAGLYRANINRVIALGVLHGSLVPAYRTAMDDSASREEREDAFTSVAGAFLPDQRRLDTPFGTVAVGTLTAPLPDGIRSDATGLLREEFSLDTFHAILQLAADLLEAEPLPVIPLYIGMTRHPTTGSFETAAKLADVLREQWSDETAIVVTGDVVHYGAIYGLEDEGSVLELLKPRYRKRLEHLFETAFVQQDLETAYRSSLYELKSDQREILPVLVHMLDGDAGADIRSFELSDYAPIFDTDPPCLVASALIAYKTQSA
ncbi:hypothetical protein ACFLSZ_01200 [Candidatus Bipolaricaulota bacterium]